MRCFSLSILTLAICVSLIGCSDDGGPKADDIQAHLASRLPPHISVKIDNLKNFPAGAGSGRTSIAGRLILLEDTYQPLPHNDYIHQHFAGLNWEADWITYILVKSRSQLGNKTLVKKVLSKGEARAFNLELAYAQTATGFRFEGASPRLDGLGNARSYSDTNQIVFNSDDYRQYMSQIEDVARQRMLLYKTILGHVDKLLTQRRAATI